MLDVTLGMIITLPEAWCPRLGTYLRLPYLEIGVDSHLVLMLTRFYLRRMGLKDKIKKINRD